MTPFNAGTHAVVLSGGGAYAAYEVGILKALAAGHSPATQNAPVDAGILTGTSAGAFNAAYLTSRRDLSFLEAVLELERLWLDQIARGPEDCENGVFRYRANIGALLHPACWWAEPTEALSYFVEDFFYFMDDWANRLYHFINASVGLQARLLSLLDVSSFFDPRAFGNLVRETIAFQAVREGKRKLIVSATNWQQGEVCLFDNHSFTEEQGPGIIIACAAVPGFFPAVPIRGALYVDGGVLMNTPLKPAIGAGAGTLHVIYLDPDVSNIPLGAFHSTMDTLDRLMVIQRACALNQDIDHAATVNRGLELLAKPEKLAGESVRSALVEFAGRLGRRSADRAAEELKEPVLAADYRQITIHRYHPQDDLGGLIGSLRFEYADVLDLIDTGYQDAVQHNCSLSGCISPSG